MFPLTRKAHSEASHAFLFLVALREHLADFFLQSGRLGDDERKILERQTSPLTELARIERQRGTCRALTRVGQVSVGLASGVGNVSASAAFDMFALPEGHGEIR